MTPAGPDDVALSVSYRHEAIEHLAAALRRSSRLQALYVRHDLGRLLRLARRVLPPGHRVVAALARRSYVPSGTPVGWSSSPRAMLAGRRRVVRFVTVDQLGVRLDAAVARRLRARAPRLFIGLPYTSLHSFTAARTVGARTCLYVNTLPWARNDALTEDAGSLASEAMRREALDGRFEPAKIRRFEDKLSLADRVASPSRRSLVARWSRRASAPRKDCAPPERSRRGALSAHAARRSSPALARPVRRAYRVSQGRSLPR